MTPARRAALRKEHKPVKGAAEYPRGPRKTFCDACVHPDESSVEWPCVVSDLLDALDAAEGSFKEFVNDVLDDMACLPKCNSLSHELYCPIVNPAAAFRQLRAALADAIRQRDERYATLAVEVKTRMEWARTCGELQTTLAALEGAAKTVLEGFDAGIFVRDTGRDAEPGWAVRLVPYISAMAVLAQIPMIPAVAGEYGNKDDGQ